MVRWDTFDPILLLSLLIGDEVGIETPFIQFDLQSKKFRCRSLLQLAHKAKAAKDGELYREQFGGGFVLLLFLFSAQNAEMIFTVISLVFSCEYQPTSPLSS